MGLEEDIFGTFFKKLRETEGFPDSVIKELERLWQTGKISSREKIFEAIKVVEK
jgi:hypothetical protein